MMKEIYAQTYEVLVWLGPAFGGIGTRTREDESGRDMALPVYARLHQARRIVHRQWKMPIDTG